MTTPHALTLLPQPPSRFDIHRNEATVRATLSLAAALTGRVKDACSRAEALLTTATDSEDAHRQMVVRGAQGALVDLKEAHALLGEILGELE